VSSKIIKSVSDFARFRLDVEVLCSCGHRARLSHITVTSRFSAKRWPKDLSGAARHFRCSLCGERAISVGPVHR
jgi:hypothetical protein